MIISFKTNIKISPEGQAQILDIFLIMSSKKISDLYYSEEDGVYRITIDNPLSQYEVAISDSFLAALERNDIEQILKGKYKDLIISDLKILPSIGQGNMSLRDALHKRFEKILSIDKDKQLQAAISSTMARLSAIKDRHTTILTQYKESALKELESESSHPMTRSTSGSFSSFDSELFTHHYGSRSAFDPFNRLPSAHYGAGLARISRGMSHIDIIEREAKERRAQIEEQNKQIEREEKERRARIDEENKKSMLKTKLSYKQILMYQQSCIAQVRTLDNFFKIAKQLEEKSIDSKAVMSTWVASFQVSSDSIIEPRPAKEGEKPGLTIDFIRSAALSWDATDELLVDGALLNKQLKGLIHCDKLETSYDRKAFKIIFTFSEAASFSSLRLHIALVEAGIENLYSIDTITNVKKAASILTPETSRSIVGESKSTESKASLPVQLSKMNIGSPISLSGDLHNRLVAELSIIANKNPSKFKPFMDAIHEKKYSKALRIACNFVDDHVFNLIKILLKYQEQLKFDINEQAGDKKYAAIHFAARAKNTDAYEYLIKHGANIHLVDADGISAEKHRALNPPVTMHKPITYST